MVEAARLSLNRSSLPLPPWRSLAYLQAKWHSPYQRVFNRDETVSNFILSSNHMQCHGLLKSLQTLLWSEIGVDPRLISVFTDDSRRPKLRAGYGSFKFL